MMNWEDVNKIDIEPLASSNISNMYLAHYDGRYFEINASVAELLGVVKDSMSLEEAVNKYVRLKGDIYSEIEVENLILKFLQGFNLPQKEQTFIFTIELFSSHTISQYAKLCHGLFKSRIMLLLTGIGIILNGCFFITTENLMNIHSFDFSIAITLFLSFLMSSLIHELGHATACQSFDIQHGGIGFGLYLNFPVFYTDVSNVWRLNRKERTIVDIAGVYFQMILLIPILAYEIYQPNDICKYIIVMMNFNFVITLNPFFKFDGYWLMTDLLGIANLRSKCNEIALHVLSGIFKKNKDKISVPYLSKMHVKVKYIFGIYLVVVNLFFGCYIFYIIPMFLINFGKTFPMMLETLVLDLSNNVDPDLQMIQKMIGQLLFLALIIYVIYRLFSPILKQYYNK